MCLSDGTWHRWRIGSWLKGKGSSCLPSKSCSFLHRKAPAAGKFDFRRLPVTCRFGLFSFYFLALGLLDPEAQRSEVMGCHDADDVIVAQHGHPLTAARDSLYLPPVAVIAEQGGEAWVAGVHRPVPASDRTRVIRSAAASMSLA